jgi:hypothetical protein
VEQGIIVADAEREVTDVSDVATALNTALRSCCGMPIWRPRTLDVLIGDPCTDALWFLLDAWL